MNEECTRIRTILSPLVCHLPIGHDGPHWDGEEKLVWKEGEPDE